MSITHWAGAEGEVCAGAVGEVCAGAVGSGVVDTDISTRP
jgi:hypothetical protein